MVEVGVTSKRRAPTANHSLDGRQFDGGGNYGRVLGCDPSQRLLATPQAHTYPPDTVTNIIHRAAGIKLISCLTATTLGRAMGWGEASIFRWGRATPRREIRPEPGNGAPDQVPTARCVVKGVSGEECVCGPRRGLLSVAHARTLTGDGMPAS